MMVLEERDKLFRHALTTISSMKTSFDQVGATWVLLPPSLEEKTRKLKGPSNPIVVCQEI